MDISSKKRKADTEHPAGVSNKKAKDKKQWSKPRKEVAEAHKIQPGDVGIWATCARNKEARSVADLRDVFEQYASNLYGVTGADGAAEGGESDDEDPDIEAEIKKELSGISKPSSEPLFTSVKLETACLLFFKTRPPIEPVSFVHAICSDAANGVKPKGCRFVKRLTPITAIGKATEKGIDEVALEVVAPHFHGPDNTGKKFAIRTSTRNNKQLKRDDVIQRIAAAVGPGHKVDLKNYDLLILVEIYQNICGMSVVGPDFEKLKRYNLEELFEVTEESGKKVEDGIEGETASRVKSARATQQE
ncbi:hypothetical protein GQ43DRAFT_432039 [Delitschia confertaspora ATCC 74209]|uniref:THUMP domain-containing protein n=1 Tax=Delitschia confertaspora ATCC 74209 TaxID=1513339 RepID=A0A9P4JK53_9PLEO|nr:hypothetical protein GQ43DRAFT_432039 [Delitschia confertaspora ATCC 74209]